MLFERFHFKNMKNGNHIAIPHQYCILEKSHTIRKIQKNYGSNLKKLQHQILSNKETRLQICICINNLTITR